MVFYYYLIFQNELGATNFSISFIYVYGICCLVKTYTIALAKRGFNPQQMLHLKNSKIIFN